MPLLSHPPRQQDPTSKRSHPKRRALLATLLFAWVLLGVARPAAIPQPLDSPTVPPRTSTLPAPADIDATTAMLVTRQDVFRRAIEAHARPAHLLILRELNTIPGSTANEFTIRSIGTLATSAQESDPIEPDAMLAMVEAAPRHYRVFTFGFAMDTDRPRITMVSGQASAWETVPASLDIAETWGALALVDVDAMMPFVLLDQLGPGNTAESLAARQRALAATIVEALDCDLPRTSTQGCSPLAPILASLASGDAQRTALVDAMVEPLGAHAMDIAAGCLMRFDPDPTPLPECVPSQLVPLANETAHRAQLAELLLAIALDDNSDGPNRMRAADALRHLIRHYPDVAPDTDTLPPFIATFIGNEQERMRRERADEAQPED